MAANRRSRSQTDQGANAVDIDRPVALVHRVCALAASPELLTDLHARNPRLQRAIAQNDTPALFDWLVAAISYQGVSNKVAEAYLGNHGGITWGAIKASLSVTPPCPKLRGYWQFYGCGFHKTSGTCAEPEFVRSCPLPDYPLRNGRLNQAAYSLYFFMRDVADSDFVGWIDDRLIEARDQFGAGQLTKVGRALIDPLRNVYGVSDKVLSMALSVLLMSAPRSKGLWIEVGAGMLAIDTLVHNFLHRSGVLDQFNARHPYGPSCYDPGGCADIVEEIADRIDARQFSHQFPASFPRFVQHAIWRYCAEDGLNVCNGNQIDDRTQCANRFCQVGRLCDRVALRPRETEHN